MDGKTGQLTAALLVILTLTACSPTLAPTNASTTAEVLTSDTADSTVEKYEEEEDMSEAIASGEAAKADLGNRLNMPVEEIEVLEVRSVIWPDASLGCAEPGMVYAQVAQEGLLIRLSAGGEMYFYHSGADQEPFLCEKTSQVVPKVTPKTDEFVPPPGSETD